mmetsp:Transcript_47135/g.143256  ORF Transcript_47135/g.143256 Transcript_47135/m.143256 type:complete len:231 (+) Transcript_47135:1469-2161(+)
MSSSKSTSIMGQSSPTSSTAPWRPNLTDACCWMKLDTLSSRVRMLSDVISCVAAASAGTSTVYSAISTVSLATWAAVAAVAWRRRADAPEWKRMDSMDETLTIDGSKPGIACAKLRSMMSTSVLLAVWLDAKYSGSATSMYTPPRKVVSGSSNEIVGVVVPLTAIVRVVVVADVVVVLDPSWTGTGNPTLTSVMLPLFPHFCEAFAIMASTTISWCDWMYSGVTRTSCKS